MIMEILVGKTRGVTNVLARNVAYWDRLPVGNEQKAYSYLVNAMQSHLDRVQRQRNQEGRRATLLGGKGLAINLLAGAKKGPCWHALDMGVFREGVIGLG